VADWLTGQTFPVAKAYHMELSRGLSSDENRGTLSRNFPVTGMASAG